MGKALADPLFMFLAVAITVQIALYREWPRLRRIARIALLALTTATAGLWLLGTHAAESYFIDRLSVIHPIPSGARIAQIDVVIVLSGGFVAAPVSAYDQPDAWTTARVIQGVRTYFASDARVLVVSGYWGGSRPEPIESGLANSELTNAMKDLAVALGVPQHLVIVEPNARTTREHPIELTKLGVVAEGETVGVVTSSWHLPRAMREFEKHFPHVVAVPAFDTATNQKYGFLRWMPRSLSLASSSTALAEYIGTIWYRIVE